MQNFGKLCPNGIFFQNSNSVDPKKVAHDEPLELDLRCLQIHLFFFFVTLSGGAHFRMLSELLIKLGNNLYKV